MSNIFDGLYVDQLFHKNERGETIFYPFGLMGRGYLLPADREAGMRRSMRWLMAFSLLFGGFFGVVVLRMLAPLETVPLLTWLIGGAAFAAGLGAIVYMQSRLSHGLEPMQGPAPTVGEWFRRGRAARAPWTHRVCLGLGLFSLVLAAGGFAMGVTEGDWTGFAAGLFMLAVGALLTWDGALGLKMRSRGDTPAHTS
ncbi:hypothetical protein [Hyphomicrobium sp.]|uniref:hypothetical protein n=1 Tax=Hyphomicrobium sp. TaxID=82 RepID=UPI003F707142